MKEHCLKFRMNGRTGSRLISPAPRDEVTDICCQLKYATPVSTVKQRDSSTTSQISSENGLRQQLSVSQRIGIGPE